MLAQTASLAGATPEQTAALIRQLVQGGTPSGVPSAAAPQQQPQQLPGPSTLNASALAANGSVFGHAPYGAAAAAAEAKPPALDKATRAAMFGPKGQVGRAARWSFARLYNVEGNCVT